jgi:hypothetical protein
MSAQYDVYLQEHRENIEKGLQWMLNKLYSLRTECRNTYLTGLSFKDHDVSKFSEAEYEAYDRYFYTSERTPSVVRSFQRAWLAHIHSNPHHWQYWVLHTDDPTEGIVALEMPDRYMIEMLCDWWTFSWANNDLFRIFKWYDEHKEHIILHAYTRKKISIILSEMKEVLAIQK